MASEGGLSGPVVEEHLRIVVKSPKDKKDILIVRNANVKQLKDIITKEFSADLEQLCLIYAGKILKDTDHLENYGIKDGTTVHLVIKSANKAQDVGGSNTQQGTAVVQPEINIAATPFGLGSLGGILGLGNLGFGSANFMDLQQQMQREVFTNPQLLSNLMQNPLVQRLMANPALLQSLLSSNPQMRELIQGNPEISRVLENPELMQQTAQVARNPAMLQELMRNSTDGSVSDNFPRSFRDAQESMLSAATSETVENKDAASVGGENSPSNTSSSGLTNDGVQSVIQQMVQNPQLMTNIVQAPYMQSILQNLAGNPEIIDQYMGSNPLVPGNSETQESVRSAMPYLYEQLANPEVHGLMGNPRALQAMMEVQQGIQELQNQAPGILGATSSGVRSTTMSTSNVGSDSSNSQINPPSDQYLQLLRQMFGTMSGARNPTTQSPEVWYEIQLNQLASMGFTNRQANIQALSATSGDLNAAVDRLLQQQ